MDGGWSIAFESMVWVLLCLRMMVMMMMMMGLMMMYGWVIWKGKGMSYGAGQGRAGQSRAGERGGYEGG